MATSKIPMIAQVSRSQFADPGWSYDSVSENDLSKVGDVVSAKFTATRAYGVPAPPYTLLQVPDGFRPSRTTNIDATVSGNGKTTKTISLSVSTEGAVKVTTGTDVSGYTDITFCVLWN